MQQMPLILVLITDAPQFSISMKNKILEYASRRRNPRDGLYY